ncbi:hypothetical protein ES705_16785 [subsurface metagenome]
MDWEKKFEIVYEKNQERKEVINMSDQTNDEKRFEKEVKIVEKYQESHPGVSYRDAVMATLDRTEETKKVFSEEEKENIRKEEENIKKVEEYLDSHPEVKYRTAALTVLGKGELNENELKVEEYIEKCKSQGIEVSYRESVLKVLPLPKKEE